MRTASLLLLLALPTLAGGPVKSERIEVELIATQTSVRPGSTITIGLRLTPDQHWHVYWKNPGDAGSEPIIKWTLPGGVTAGEISWPFPVRLPMPGDIMNYGYAGEVVLPVEVTVPATAKGTIELKAEVDWLVCDPNMCIPGDATLTLELPVKETAPAPHPRHKALFEWARQKTPGRAPGNTLVLSGGGGELRLRIELAAKSAYFFPSEWPVGKHSARQDFANKVLTLRPGTEMERLRGVLVLDDKRAYEVDLTIGAAEVDSMGSISMLLVGLVILVIAAGVVLLARR